MIIRIKPFTHIYGYMIPLWTMVAINFAIPILVFMDASKKKVPVTMVIVGTFILIGHYLDVFVMIMLGS